MNTLLRRVARSGAADRGAALLVALMVILMATMASIVGLGVIIAQADRTIVTGTRADTLAAAESGLDVAMGTFKTAVTDSLGDRTKLPCKLKVQTDRGSFTVDVGYYLDNPSQQDAAWRAANTIPCAENAGPLQTPYFALLTATTSDAAGTVGLGDRSLETVFQFGVQTQPNVPGGFIRNYNDGAVGTLVLCFDAGSGSPSAGTVLRMQTCLEEDDPLVVRQKFSYRPDYRISLTATETGQGVGGMCLTAARPSSTTSPTNVEFRPCDTARVDQLWSYNDVAQFQGENSDGQSLGDWCLVFGQYNTLGSAVVASRNSVCGQGYERQWTWRPNEDVGAAAAGDPDKLPTAASLVYTQLVNYLEFGRCFDITSQNVNSPFMIAFPCKMDASVRRTNLTTTSGSTTANLASTTGITRGMRIQHPSVPADTFITNISGSTITMSAPATATGTAEGRFPVLPAFNQLLSYEPVTATTGRLTTTNNSGTKVCLQTPSSTANPPYVTTPGCSSATSQLWTVNRDIGDPVMNYTVVDSLGRCLGLGPPGSTVAPLNQWSTVVAETCNPAGLVLGALDQKWNAPPGLASGQRLDVNEVPPAP